MQAEHLDTYDRWIGERMDELVEHYGGKVVAVYEGEVVIVGESEEVVYGRIRERGLEPMPLVFRVPSDEDLQSIL